MVIIAPVASHVRKRRIGSGQIFNFKFENSNEEAKFATQFAVWTYLSKLDFNKIEPLNSSNQNVVNAIKKIYTNGVNNKIEDNSLNIEEIDKDFNIDNINKEYYSKRIRLIYNENVKEIILSNLSQDIKICDLNNNFLDKVTNQKEIKLMVKRDKIIQDSNITFSFLYQSFFLFQARLK